MGKIKYSTDYLLERLRDVLNKYGKIQTKLIDSDPDFPSRNAYVKAFGSIEKACMLIGYEDYQKWRFTIEDAQKTLDKRNGHFKLIEFHGMRNKCIVQCKECGFIYDDITPDNLLRNKTDIHYGCKNCNNKLCKTTDAIQIIQEEPIQYSLKEIQEKYPIKDNCGYVYEILNLKNNKRYIGSTINPYERWIQHIRAAYTEDNPSYDYPLQSAIRKYGVDNFIFNVIYSDIPIIKLPEEEKNAIIKYNSLTNSGWGYNQTLETECALRDKQFKPKGVACALVNQEGDVLIKFDSYHEASRVLFGNNEKATKICAVCNGRRKTCSGMKFIKLKE